MIDGTIMFKQVMDLWVLPELQRRGLPPDFKLQMVQIIFNLNSPKVHVRLNSEVKAIIKMKGLVEKGSPVYAHQIEGLEEVKLIDNRDKNSGHVTLINSPKGWVMAFDFIYNKSQIAEYVAAAKEFFEAAEFSFSKGNIRPVFENCFAAAELCVHAILLALPTKVITEKTHDATLTGVEAWAKLGNIDAKYVNTLKLLNMMRKSARYMSSTEFKKQDHKKLLNEVSELITFAGR